MNTQSPRREELIYVNRQGTDCVKWDAIEDKFGQAGLMPLWIADMDFKAPLCVRRALTRWVEEGAFGYYCPPQGYYDAFINWQAERHGVQVKQEHIRFSPGVVTAIYWLLNAISRPGDGVLVLTPVYYPFFSAISDTNRRIVRSELINKGGCYTMDFDDIEQKIMAERVTAMILCSPHNPVGRVWNRDELERLLSICRRRDVKVIADEIHQDMMPGDKKNIPAATIDPTISTLTSATKTFNLAGLHHAFAIIPQDTVRAAYDTMAKDVCLSSGSTAGYIATRAAYEQGAPWLETLLAQVRDNYNDLRTMIAEALPQVVFSPLEGTYLAWLDLSAYLKPGETKAVIQEKCRLAIDFGDWFGGEAYCPFIRINLATRNEDIREAARRIIAALLKI